MSRVIDGRDILKRNSYLAIVMSTSLDGLLHGSGKEIPKNVLKSAQSFFSTGMEVVREIRGLSRITRLDSTVTYRLLTDMLRKVKKVEEKDIDSELEKLAIALEVLTPDGRQVVIAQEHYRTLRQIFRAIYAESNRYCPQRGEHSPYSIGTFD